jgi:hypothetical protein
MKHPKKRPPGNTRGPVRTTGMGQLIGVRLQKPLLTSIDAWAKSEGKISRQEAMRRLIERGLSGGK